MTDDPSVDDDFVITSFLLDGEVVDLATKAGVPVTPETHEKFAALLLRLRDV